MMLVDSAQTSLVVSTPNSTVACHSRKGGTETATTLYSSRRGETFHCNVEAFDACLWEGYRKLTGVTVKSYRAVLANVTGFFKNGSLSGRDTVDIFRWLRCGNAFEMQPPDAKIEFLANWWQTVSRDVLPSLLLFNYADTTQIYLFHF
jgi:hypothetical protein